MMKKILLSCCLALCTLVAWAAKANPTPVTVTQSDGTLLTVYQYGDEHFSWISTADGTLLTQVGMDFYVAEIGKDGTLKASGQLAHNDGQRLAAEKELVRKQGAMRNAFFDSISRRLNKEAKTRAVGKHTPPYFPHSGNPKVLVILAQFSDVKFSLPDPVKSFNDYFNHDASAGPLPDYGNNEKRNYGSVRQYFKDMSGGQFTPQFVVVGPVTLPKESSYYGKDGTNKDTNIGELIQDACHAVEGSVNFSDYDGDNDGYVDLVYVLHAGYGQNASPKNPDFIWPKSGTTTPFKMGGKTVCRYGVSNELNYNPAHKFSSAPSKRINGIGLFCHEFSHTMGLPDFYPYNKAAEKDDQTMELWDLMDGGEYTDNGYTPTPYTPWEKDVMGWKTLTPIQETPAKITLKVDEALKVPTSYQKEYLILHNIQKEGWASKLLGQGMLVYRVNYEPETVNMYDHVNDTPGKPGMTIVPADGKLISSYSVHSQEEQQKYYASHAGDPFPGTSHVDHIGSIKLNQSTMNKPLFHITENTDGTITFEYLKDLTAAGINDITTEQQGTDNRIYTLDGRFVGTDRTVLPPGIYIQNRKKFVK